MMRTPFKTSRDIKSSRTSKSFCSKRKEIKSDETLYSEFQEEFICWSSCALNVKYALERIYLSSDKKESYVTGIHSTPPQIKGGRRYQWSQVSQYTVHSTQQQCCQKVRTITRWINFKKYFGKLLSSNLIVLSMNSK